jgi:hypothetical protein
MIASSDSKQVDLSLKYVCKYRMMCMSPSEAPKHRRRVKRSSWLLAVSKALIMVMKRAYMGELDSL